jgi:hypothetical protein
VAGIYGANFLILRLENTVSRESLSGGALYLTLLEILIWKEQCGTE